MLRSPAGAELVQDASGEAGAEAATAEIGMDGEGVEAAGAGARAGAAQEADGPAGECAGMAGDDDAGARIAQETADLAGIEALARVPEADGFEAGQFRQGGRGGGAAGEVHPQVAGTAAAGAGAGAAGTGRVRQYLARRRMGR